MTRSLATSADPDAAASPPPGRDLRQLLDRLVAVAGVRGGLVVAADGLAIAARLPAGLAPEPLAALGAALGRELELRAARAGGGTLAVAEFVAEQGALFVDALPIGFVVLLVEREAPRDAVRRALREATDAARRAWRR